jgi:hypothetical protein
MEETTTEIKPNNSVTASKIKDKDGDGNGMGGWVVNYGILVIFSG